MCVECLIGKQKKPILFKVTEPSSIPYRAPPACAKIAAYPDPGPPPVTVILVPESIAAQAAYQLRSTVLCVCLLLQDRVFITAGPITCVCVYYCRTFYCRTFYKAVRMCYKVLFAGGGTGRLQHSTHSAREEMGSGKPDWVGPPKDNEFELRRVPGCQVQMDACVFGFDIFRAS